MIEKLRQVDNDSAEVKSLAKDLKNSLEQFQKSNLPIAGKWLQGLDKVFDCRDRGQPQLEECAQRSLADQWGEC